VAASADRALLDTLAALDRTLRRIAVPAMIIGGIAVIARGVPRQTIDVDATVWAEAITIDHLIAELARDAIVPRTADAAEFAHRHQVLLLRHEPTGTPLEIALAWLPFEREALERASEVDFGGIALRVATVEDLVIYKAVAWRDRDRADIERLLVLQGTEVNFVRVRRLVEEFADALEEPERLREFDALVQRAHASHLR
jgi:predicted nucleotidyltransferase